MRSSCASPSVRLAEFALGAPRVPVVQSERSRARRRPGPADSACAELGPVLECSSHVKSRRYTVVIADRTTGVVRRFTLSLRPALTAWRVVLALPVLIGLGARWSALAEVSALRDQRRRPRQENESFRAMTGPADRPDRRRADGRRRTSAPRRCSIPESARALAKLPASGQDRARWAAARRAANRARSCSRRHSCRPKTRSASLRDLLGRLGAGSRRAGRSWSAARSCWAPTPSIWPAQRPLSADVRQPRGSVRRRRQRATTPGLDISGDRGQPVFATAGGVVESPGWNGDYGNMVVDRPRLRHRHALRATCRRFAVRPGDRVERGQTIGQVGSTGRVTGPHLHYEVLVNGTADQPAPAADRPAAGDRPASRPPGRCLDRSGERPLQSLGILVITRPSPYMLGHSSPKSSAPRTSAN